MSMLSDPYSNDEEAVFAELESMVWPVGPTFPHCGDTHRVAFSVEDASSTDAAFTGIVGKLSTYRDSR